MMFATGTAQPRAGAGRTAARPPHDAHHAACEASICCARTVANAAGSLGGGIKFPLRPPMQRAMSMNQPLPVPVAMAHIEVPLPGLIGLDTRRMRALLHVPHLADAAPAPWAHALLARLEGIATPADAAAQLPVLPAAMAALLAALNDDRISVSALCAILAQDAVLVGETLRMANSAFVRPIRPIAGLEEAVSMLGFNGLRRIASQLAMQPLFLGLASTHGRMAAAELWTDARLRAHLAALECSAPARGFDCFIAGLAGDVGMLALLVQLGATRPTPAAAAQWRALVRATRRIGALAAQHWQLPEAVQAWFALRAGMPAAGVGEALRRSYEVASVACAIESPLLAPALGQRLCEARHPWAAALRRAVDEVRALEGSVEAS